MTAKIIPQNCPKFTISLKSHTQKKRLIEAKQKIEKVYPFEVSETNILIIKTDKKNLYDTYILNEPVKNEADIKKLFLIFFFFILIISLIILVIRYTAIKNTESLKIQREQEKQKLEESRLQKEKENKLENLKKEFEEKILTEYEKIYPYIQRIYSVMTEKTTIENISLEKNSFSVEVTTKDALSILSNFENSRAFTSVRMSRTTVKDTNETVTYNGEFSRTLIEADENLSIDKKIDFYETRLLELKEQSVLKQKKQLSEYIKTVRSVMHKNGCSEQYIQIKGKDDCIEIEMFILSTSSNILNFLKELQEGKENIIDIKRFSLRNSENRNRIQTTICFATGIDPKLSSNQYSDYIDKRIEPSEIDRLFYKTSAPKSASEKTNSSSKSTNIKKTVKENQTLPHKKLSYIGLTKISGKDFVMAKDDDMKSIYKLIVTDSETDGDFCIRTDNGYAAKIRGEYYEVRK